MQRAANVRSLSMESVAPQHILQLKACCLDAAAAVAPATRAAVAGVPADIVA